MVKRLKVILLLAGVAAVCAGLAACQSLTVQENYENQGYVVSVNFDPSGGKFLGRDGVTITDMFKPSDYAVDEDGNVSIKISDPLDPDRPSSGDGITLARGGYSLLGWYQGREVVKNENGDPVDDSGHVLYQKEDGSYYYLDEKGIEVTTTPSYTYSEPWNFEEDRLIYEMPETGEPEEKMSVTLYAGWVADFEFDYFYEENGEWVKYGSTTFSWANYASEENSDLNTIWMPDWLDGAMNYTYTYSSASLNFDFPSREGYTFSAAYTDENRTQQIEGSTNHTGSVDYEHCIPIGRVQNIYVDFLEGTRYRIDKVSQLTKAENVNPAGYYEILANLDFKDAIWPSGFESGSFTGRFESSAGNTFTISNLTVTHSGSSTNGGIFGEIAGGAVVQNINFQNVTFDIASAGRVNNANFGLFAGYISEDASVANINITDAEMRIGSITLGSNYSINLVANGDRTGVTCEPVVLAFYGQDMTSVNLGYRYTVVFTLDENDDPIAPNVEVDENGNLQFEFVASFVYAEQAEYIINYQEANNNE